MSAGSGQTRILDTTGWSLVVPLKPAANLTGFHLTARLAGAFGGVVADLDSAALVPGYDGAHEVDWTADPITGLTDRLILTVTPEKRDGWLATDTGGRPAQMTVFADVLYTVAGSGRAPEPLGRTGFLVMPATNSPLVALAGGPNPVLIAGQVGQVATTTALQVGPQGPRGVPGPAGGGQSQSFPVAVPMSGHRCVRISNDHLLTASVDEVSHADTCFGITAGGGAAGSYVEVRSAGVMEEAAWTWVPGPIFLGLDGMLTQAPPRAAFEQRVGVAVGPTRMLVSIESAIISAH